MVVPFRADDIISQKEGKKTLTESLPNNSKIDNIVNPFQPILRHDVETATVTVHVVHFTEAETIEPQMYHHKHGETINSEAPLND